MSAACVIAHAAAMLLEQKSCMKIVLLRFGKRTSHSILNMVLRWLTGANMIFRLTLHLTHSVA